MGHAGRSGPAGGGYLARRAQRGFERSQVPLLGVMGAFVFAAQMINFPVGIGTTRPPGGRRAAGLHAGSGSGLVVMSAIIAIQALVFQDGGILALGANVFNMAIAGRAGGLSALSLWGGGRSQAPGDFRGRIRSRVMVSAVLALANCCFRACHAAAVLGISLALFVVSALRKAPSRWR